MATGISLLDALQNRMGWLSGRQKVVAENVANASTPGFKPHDLAPQDFGQLMAGGSSAEGQMGMMVTNAMHIQMQNPLPAGAKKITSNDSETTMDGNSVVLEEQMLQELGLSLACDPDHVQMRCPFLYVDVESAKPERVKHAEL